MPVAACALVLMSWCIPAPPSFCTLPNNAYAAMGICVTILKRRCRSVGITAWPYRKMAMIEKRIQLREMMLNGNAELTDDSSDALRAEILELRSRMELLRRNPNLKSCELV